MLLLGDQNVYQRFSSAESPETARKSAVGFFVGAMLVVSLVIVLASSAAVLLPQIPPDTAILSLAGESLPVFLGGLLLASSVAIIITTGNSYLLSAAGNLVYDIYSNLFGRRIPEGRELLYDRIAVAVLGVLAYVLGAFFPTVLALQIVSYTIYGAGVTPALVAALVWRRATPAGGVASILTGAVVTLVWELVLGQPLNWNAVLVALPASVIVLIVVSLMTSNRPGLLAGEQAEEPARVV